MVRTVSDCQPTYDGQSCPHLEGPKNGACIQMVLIMLFLAAGLAFVLDQGSKKLALTRFEGEVRAPGRSGPRIRVVRSPTLGLGLVRSRSTLILLWVVALSGTILLILRGPSFQGYAAPLGLGAAIGGATGNLLDMLRRGAVVDFIDLRICPVFNVADSLIVVGVVAALCSIW
jgi:signal peptidase II